MKMLNLFYKKFPLASGVSFHDRNFYLDPQHKHLIGKTIFVYNGKKYIPILIKEAMLNRKIKIGSLVINRRILIKSQLKKHHTKKRNGTRRKSN